MGASCETSSGSCGESSCDTSSCGREQCACGTDCGGDPVTCATAMWSSSFMQAMKAVQVELLKAKIQKAWGAKMDKAADAVIEAMGAQWQSMLAQAKAKADLGGTLQRLWYDTKK